MLIENQVIDFQSGFSVITGETGAGKSIILGALGLILGDRADTEVVLNKEQKCIVEASFNVETLNLQDFFKTYDLDYDPISIVRREISKAGKSRAFVNDTPVNLNILKNLGVKLMDIHSQNQNHQLNQTDYRMGILDAYANHEPQLEEYKSLFNQYKNGLIELDLLKASYQKQVNEQEYHQYLFDEIEKANIQEGEQKEIEEELQILSHAEEIKSALFQSSNEIINSDQNIVHQLEALLSQVRKIASFQSDIEQLEKRLESVIIELKDIGGEASALEEQFQFDPSRIAFLNDKLETIITLCRKHRLENADELIAFKEELSSRIYTVTHLDSEINKLNEKQEILLNKLKKRALLIRANRINASKKIEKLVLKELKGLGLQEAELKIELLELNDITKSGIDNAKFLFKANKGSHFSEMSKVASGGEISRLMLSFKYTLAMKKSLPSIIFDEIDSGVSGEIADKLARLMNKLGEKSQVISITHLPQIAAKAHHHYLVYKENDSIFTRSKIKKLNQQNRLKEIAAMLSGSVIGDSALNHAEELLGTKS